MFRLSSKSSQLDLFSGTQSLLTGRSLKIYEDKSLWHNQFREQVTRRIDESLFSPLYKEDFGSPNAPIRILIGMMVLKEAQGWSDLQLFEHCQFNLLVRSALGLFNIDDPIPADSTYYLLRKRIVNYEKEGHENLIEKVFARITKSQAIDFQINGNKIRMDSKLMGSNIAWYSRYELIHETLSIVYGQNREYLDRKLSESDINILSSISGESGDKVCYRSNRQELKTKMSAMGKLIDRLLCIMSDSKTEALQTLRRVFGEQYEIIEGTVSVRSKHEISAKSVQSPYDTECTYRDKDGNRIKGYSINLTETCNPDNAVNLITGVLTETASAADCDFLQTAIEAAGDVVSGDVKTVNADGAYHNAGNQNYCEEKRIDLVVSAIQGKTSRYDLQADEKEGLIVTDLTTHAKVPVRKVESRKDGTDAKWVIKTENNRYRYFTQKDIDTCLLRHKIAGRPQAALNFRNNVEASIFQLGYHYPNDKSRYRGLIKHKMWANVRCLWINFVRLSKFIALSCPNYALNLKNRLVSSDILFYFFDFRRIPVLVSNHNTHSGGFLTLNGFLKKYFL